MVLTLATAHFVKVLLSSPSTMEGEFYPIGMWFMAILLDFVLLAGVLVVFGR